MANVFILWRLLLAEPSTLSSFNITYTRTRLRRMYLNNFKAFGTISFYAEPSVYLNMSFQTHMLERNCKFRVFSVHSGDTLLNIIHAYYPIHCCLLFQQLSCGLQMKFKLLRHVTPCRRQLLSRRHGVTSRKRTGVRTSNVAPFWSACLHRTV